MTGGIARTRSPGPQRDRARGPSRSRADRPGKPLERSVRDAMAQRFGHDFGAVRVHADAAADASARSLGAAAFTCGQDIYFAAGGYRPDTADGRVLLAHELAHTVQQQDGTSAAPAAAAEREAAAAGAAFARGTAIPAQTRTAPGIALQQARQPAGTTGRLSAIEGWSYIVYEGEVKLRYYRTLPPEEAKRRAEKKLPGHVQVGTIPWVTNNPGNITQTAGAPTTTLQGAPADLGSLGVYGGRYAVFGSEAQGAAAIGPYLTRLPSFGTNKDLNMAGAIKQFKGEEPSEKAAREAREKENTDRAARGEKPLPRVDVREEYLGRVKEIMRQRMMEAEALEGGEALEDLDAAQRRAVQEQADRRIAEFLARPAKDVAAGDAALVHAAAGIHEVEGRAAAPGVVFTCAGFDDPRGRAPYDGEQKQVIQALRDSEAARREVAAVLGCGT